jgi:hypothetical protein
MGNTFATAVRENDGRGRFCFRFLMGKERKEQEKKRDVFARVGHVFK